MTRTFFFSLTIALIVCSSSLAVETDESVCVNLVDGAVNLVKEKGLDYALKVLNSSNGPYRRGPLYAVVITFDGKLIAHPVNKELLSVDQFTLKDVNGKYFVKEMMEVAKTQGSGWVEYMWQRHGEKQPVKKRAYVKRVPGADILILAGYYPDKGSDSIE